jgi:hypothetical protein
VFTDNYSSLPAAGLTCGGIFQDVIEVLAK